MGKRKYDDDSVDVLKKSKTENSLEDHDNGTDVYPQRESGPKSKEVKHVQPRLFDIKHFRKELQGKSGQTMALTQFLQVCLNPDSDADYMLEYLKVGGNSHEILRQISQDNKKNLTLATPTFHLFHLIILKVQSDLPHMITVTEEACRYYLNTFVSTIEIMISENSGPRHRKIILNLLTSMVTLNSDLGVEILNQLPLTPKNLQHVVEKPNYKEKDNVRTAFVHFMTSFLVDGHLPLIKALLEKQGLLSLVIPGLVQDEANAVMMFLSILKKNVIDNNLISKTLKLKTFSHQVLHNMFRLFTWKGPPESERKPEAHQEITALLSAIILTLFTSHKLGLYFVDNTLGTGDTNKNQNLYKAIQLLKRPWENESQSEIILQILYKCPDLHRAIVSVIEQNFQPQHSPMWEKTVGFKIKLLETLKPEKLITRLNNLNALQTANFIRFVTMPVPILKLINSGIGKDLTISTYCIKVLVKMLQTLKKYMQILELDDSDVKYLELKSKLDNFLPKHMPAPNLIVSLINNTIDKTNTDSSQDFKLPSLNEADSLLILIDLLLLYNYTYPTSFEALEGTIDLKKILDFSKQLSTGNLSLLKFKVVSLWLLLDSSALTLQNPMFRELFLIMLEVFTDDNDTWIEAKDTLYLFFKNTEIFEGDEDEIHLMLYTLRNTKVNPISLVGDIIEYVLSNGRELTEYVRNQVVNFEISDENSQTSLDNLFNNLMNGKNTDESVFLEKKIPSAFIVGCMQFIQNNRDAKKNMKSFLCLYVSNLLHCNYSPELTEVLIGDSKLDIRSYVVEWTVTPVAFPEGICVDQTVRNLAKSIIDNENISLTSIFSILSEAMDTNEDMELMGTKYTLDYSHPFNSSDLFIWSKYLIFCGVRLASMDQMSIERQRKISLYFEAIIVLGKKWHMVDICRSIILNLFKNAHILKLFQPFGFGKNPSNVLVTHLLLQIIEQNKDIVNFLDKKHYILKSYQQKVFNDIMKAFIKIKKRKNANSDLLIRILETIGLSKEYDYQIFDHIFSVDTNACIGDDKEPSIVLKLLRVLLNKYSRSVVIELTNEILKKCFDLYTTLLVMKETTVNLTDVEDALADYFENKPHQAIQMSDDQFRKFFEANAFRKSTSQLAAILLKYNYKFCNIFKEAIQNREILSQREITLPLSNVLLNHTQFINENKEIFNMLNEEYKSNINKFLEKPHKAGQAYLNSANIIRKIIVECMTVQECQKFFSKIHKFEAVELSHVNLMQVVFLKLCLPNNSFKKDHIINYFLSMLNTLSLAIKENKDTIILDNIVFNLHKATQIIKTVEHFQADQKEDFKKITESGIWQSFCKTVLKDSLRIRTAQHENSTGPKLLCLLSCLCKLFYQKGHEDIITLFDMVTSHSEFLNVMLSHFSPDVKCRLLEFLFVLVSTNKSVMKTQQIPVYLSAYRATRSPSDRIILTILQFYEVNDMPVNEYKPYIWGDSAANHYSVRKNRTASLWSHPTPNQVMNLFDKEIIERTVTYFPVNQRLDDYYEISTPGLEGSSVKKFLENTLTDNKVKLVTKDTEGAIHSLLVRHEYGQVLNELRDIDIVSISHMDTDESIYDPAFLFPLLGHILAPGSIASCFKLLRSGLLSVPVMGLSSNCPLMRAAAFHVLHRFCLLLETETRHKNDKLLLNDFITTLRQSLSTAINSQSNGDKFNGVKNPKLPAIGALYLARALTVATSPSEPLYKPVNNYLIAKQFVDLTVVPDFLSLFHDSDVESADRRLWILDIISNGTKSMTDVVVIFKTMCLKMIMDVYTTVLSDRKTKVAILKALTSIVAIPKSFNILVEGYGFMSWLHCVIRNIGGDKVIVKEMFRLIEAMMYSLGLNVFTKNCSKHVLNGNADGLTEFRMKSDVEYEILSAIYDLLPHTNEMDAEDVVIYLKLLNLITKRSVKFLTKKQILNIVSSCMTRCEQSDRVKLVHQAVVLNSALVLYSKSICGEAVTSEDELIKQLRCFVQTYVA